MTDEGKVLWIGWLWCVVVGRGDRHGLGVLNVLNKCGVVCWMRCGSGWSGFVFSRSEFEFVSSGFLVFIFIFIFHCGLLF